MEKYTAYRPKAPQNNVFPIRLKKLDLNRYREELLIMPRIDLLQEMMKYQEEAEKLKTQPYPFLQKGSVLFSVIEFVAQTDDLRSIASAYRRHLDFQMSLS